MSLSFHFQPFCQSLPFGEFNPFTFKVVTNEKEDFPGGSVSKEPTCNAGDLSLIPWLGERMVTHSSIFAWDRVDWWATVHGVARVRHDLTTKAPPVKKNLFLLLCYLNSCLIPTLSFIYPFLPFFVENSSRDGNTRPPDLLLEKPICRSGSNS